MIKREQKRKLVLRCDARRGHHRSRRRSGGFAAQGRGAGRERAPPRCSRSIRCGRSRCPTTGCSAGPSGTGSTSRTTSGSSTAAPAALHNNERGAELNPPIAECCRTAPPVLVFDPDGNLVRSWGGPGPGYEWPQSNHGIHVDYKGNVWIGGNGEKDAHLLKFTKDGKFLMQVGGFGKNAGSNDLEFRRVAQELGRSEDQRGLRRGRLSQQARGGDRCRYRQDEALLGRVRQPARRHQSRPYDPPRRRRSSSATPSIASSARTTGWSTCAIVAMTDCRCSGRTGPS